MVGYKNHTASKVGNPKCYKHYKNSSKQTEAAAAKKGSSKKRKYRHNDFDEEEKEENSGRDPNKNTFFLEDDEDPKMEVTKVERKNENRSILKNALKPAMKKMR